MTTKKTTNSGRPSVQALASIASQPRFSQLANPEHAVMAAYELWKAAADWLVQMDLQDALLESSRIKNAKQPRIRFEPGRVQLDDFLKKSLPMMKNKKERYQEFGQFLSMPHPDLPVIDPENALSELQKNGIDGSHAPKLAELLTEWREMHVQQSRSKKAQSGAAMRHSKKWLTDALAQEFTSIKTAAERLEIFHQFMAERFKSTSKQAKTSIPGGMPKNYAFKDKETAYLVAKAAREWHSKNPVKKQKTRAKCRN